MDVLQDPEGFMRLAETWWTRAESTKRSAEAQRFYSSAIYIALRAIYEQNKQMLQLLQQERA
jgi:hypothetical protein